MRKQAKKKAKKSFSKPIAKKKKKAVRAAKPTKVASTRSANGNLVVPAPIKASLAARAKAAGLSGWKAMAQNLLSAIPA